MDMRDPWSMVPAMTKSRASPLWFWLASRHERRAVERAALVVANTEPLRAAMEVAYPGSHEHVITVMNGYDEESVPSSKHGPCFTIRYAGSIYIDRDPRNFFRAAARFVHEVGATPKTFRIEFIGKLESYGSEPISSVAREEGLAGYVRTAPPRSRREAMKFMAEATMLLSLPQDVALAIPSKIFEYMRFDAWLLVLARRDSAIELLLRGTSADVVAPDDVDRIVAILRQRYAQHTRGERPTRIATDTRFSRRAQAQILFDAIDRCIEKSGSP
jgi:glycosyltransferase involved in cell wall biosynthesis